MPKKVKKEEKKIERVDNKETIVSKTDECKTPAPPSGPVPIPYPNIAKSSDTSSGTKTVKIEGKEVSTKDDSSYKKSTGDEASTKKPLRPVEGYLPRMTRLFKDHPILIIISLAVLCVIVWYLFSNVLYHPPPIEEPLEEPLVIISYQR